MRTTVENQNILALLNQVGGNKVPSEGAGAGDDEGLGVGLGGEEELAELGQGLAEGSDKGSADVRLAGYNESTMRALATSRVRGRLEAKRTWGWPWH